MRRVAALSVSTLFVVPLVLALPVYAAPAPQPEPVEVTVQAVEMGSVTAPAPEAELQEGTTEPVEGQTAAEQAAPVLVVSQPRTDPFSAVGVTWAHDPAVTDTVVQVRVADGDGRWGEWVEVDRESADAGASADAGVERRGGTSPLWTGDSRGVEVELLTRSGAAPSDVQVELIDPGASAADSTPGSPSAQDQAHAASTMPAIFSRQQWGADETIRTWEPEYADTLKAATIHHTAGSNSYASADVPQILRSIYRYHAVSLGWGDIGYNVVVDKFGRAWEGRHGGLASTVIGAHAGGFNTATSGISMIGNYDTVQPTAAMLETVAQVVAWKLSLYRIDPRGTTTLTRYGTTETLRLPTVFAHRDVGKTACPGQYGYAKMDWLRTRVAEIVDSMPRERWWELRDTTGAGRADHQVWYGGSGAVTLACDFDGDGKDDPVAVDGAMWHIRTSGGGNSPDVFSYGVPGWVPLCGDWDGDGRAGIAVYDGTGTWYLRQTASPGHPDAGHFQYGWWAASPVVGDWDGNGTDTIGVYERGAGNWLVRNVNAPGAPHRTVQYGFPGAQPVPADYNGDMRTDLGVFAAGRWWLRMSFSPGAAHEVFDYGLSTDKPVPGNWDGARGAGVGVSRPDPR